MKTLEEIKEEVAIHAGYNDFSELFLDISKYPDQGIFDLYYDEISRVYAKNCVKKMLEDVSGKVYDQILDATNSTTEADKIEQSIISAIIQLP